MIFLNDVLKICFCWNKIQVCFHLVTSVVFGPNCIHKWKWNIILNFVYNIIILVGRFTFIFNKIHDVIICYNIGEKGDNWIYIGICLLRTIYRFESWSGLTKDYEIGICCFSAKHAPIRNNSKDWLACNQDNVSDRTYMSIHEASTIRILVSDWSISNKSPLKLPSQMNRNLVGSIYMYGRFCIKFPQSRMKGERHRLSPLSL